MGAIGKFNKTVCQILLAKAQMDMNKDYTGALALLNDARTNGKKPNGEISVLLRHMVRSLTL